MRRSQTSTKKNGRGVPNKGRSAASERPFATLGPVVEVVFVDPLIEPATTADQLIDLIVAGRPAWQRRGACRRRPDVTWFPEPEDDPGRRWPSAMVAPSRPRVLRSGCSGGTRRGLGRPHCAGTAAVLKRNAAREDRGRPGPSQLTKVRGRRLPRRGGRIGQGRPRRRRLSCRRARRAGCRSASGGRRAADAGLRTRPSRRPSRGRIGVASAG
jgi:hypothetical protein